MRKRILFVSEHMQMNGAMKSLLSLFSLLDLQKYEIHLFLYAHGDALMGMIPAHVKVLTESLDMRIFDLSFFKGVCLALKHGQINLFFWRLYAVARRLFFKDPRAKECWWHKLPVLDDEYDVAIGFCEGSTNRFVGEKVKAKKKIGWVHLDYSQITIDNTLEKQTFDRLDMVATVSENCRDVLLSMLNLPENKVLLVPNVIDSTTVISMANKKEADIPSNHTHYIVSVGRISSEKGFDIALEACRLLVENGTPVVWHVIGPGDPTTLVARAKQYGLSDRFEVIGTRSNPYPYMKACRLYVQPSRFEGRSVAIEEAKILKKAIVASDIPSVHEQIIDGTNGAIAKLTPEDLFEKIKGLFDNPSRIQQFEDALANHTPDNQTALKAFEAIVS